MSVPTIFTAPLALTTALQDLFTAPPGKNAAFDLCQITNVSAVEVLATVQVVRAAANGGGSAYLAYETPLQKGDSLSPVGGGLRLGPGDKLRVKASASPALEAYADGTLWDATA